MNFDSDSNTDPTFVEFQYVDLTPGSATFGDVTTESYAEFLDAETQYAELRFYGKADVNDFISVDYLISGEYFDFRRDFDGLDSDTFQSIDTFNVFNPDRSVGDIFFGATRVGGFFTQFDEVTSISGFVSVDFYEKLRINAGIRYDDRVAADQETGEAKEEFPVTATSYTAAAVYDVTENISAYYSYAEVVEFLNDPTCDGNTLPAVPGRTHEIGVKYEPTDNLLLTGALYDASVQGATDFIDCPVNTVIGANGGGGFVFTGDEVTSRGIEIEAIGDITPELSIIAGYSYTDLEEDGPAFDRSYHLFSIFSVYEWQEGFLDGFGIGLGAQVETDRVVSRDAGDPALGLPLDDIFIVDASAFYEINENINVALNVRNLTDETLFIPEFSASDCCIIPAAGRSVIGTVNLRF
ncbi:MAG: TonB-dependent receptor [Pseudomonadota bacterium]